MDGVRTGNVVNLEQIRRMARPHERLIVPVVPENLEALVGELVGQGWVFFGLVAEHPKPHEPVRLRYLWYQDHTPWLELELVAYADEAPTISSFAFAADWPEREVEDLFGVRFGGHPVLGNFVLHDERWLEGSAPMRSRPDYAQLRPLPSQGEPPRLRMIVDAPGAFVFPVGPVFSGVEESVQLVLETVGEEVVFSHVRLFYKYRGIEKLMEGRSAVDGVLLAERVSGTAGFAHGLAYVQAVEALGDKEVPARAQALRVFWAEFERIRSHIRTLAGIVESTGLSVPANLLSAQEEALLQIAGEYVAHRYLFGLNVVGGIAVDWPDATLDEVFLRVRAVVATVDEIYSGLQFDNSFLDRLEEVGQLGRDQAATLGVVGPLARASGIARDLRHGKPYAYYPRLTLAIPVEDEGDGYARARVLVQEIHAALNLMRAVVHDLPSGPVWTAVNVREGVGMGAVESPAGALAYWVRIGQSGHVARCHIMPPNLVNWHALPYALRRYAFQDVPIILATFGLSVADADR